GRTRSKRSTLRLSSSNNALISSSDDEGCGSRIRGRALGVVRFIKSPAKSGLAARRSRSDQAAHVGELHDAWGRTVTLKGKHPVKTLLKTYRRWSQPSRNRRDVTAVPCRRTAGRRRQALRRHYGLGSLHPETFCTQTFTKRIRCVFS